MACCSACAKPHGPHVLGLDGNVVALDTAAGGDTPTVAGDLDLSTLFSDFTNVLPDLIGSFTKLFGGGGKTTTTTTAPPPPPKDNTRTIIIVGLAAAAGILLLEHKRR